MTETQELRRFFGIRAYFVIGHSSLVIRDPGLLWT